MSTTRLVVCVICSFSKSQCKKYYSVLSSVCHLPLPHTCVHVVLTLPAIFSTFMLCPNGLSVNIYFAACMHLDSLQSNGPPLGYVVGICNIIQWSILMTPPIIQVCKKLISSAFICTAQIQLSFHLMPTFKISRLHD